MSERFTMRVPASELGGDVIAPGAMDQQIGGTMVVHVGSRDVEGLVLAAEVVKDGTAVDVTLAVPDGTLPKQPLAGYSISEP